MARIKDVAQLAGVSTATVSRVLNGASVGGDLAERVRTAVEALSYTPNRAARSLRRRSSDVIALVIPDVENPFFTSLARGVEDVARSVGYSVVLCNTDDRPEQEATYLRIATDENMAGVIIAPARRDIPLDGVLASGRAVVVIDRSVDAAVDQVTFDNVELGRRAAATLLDSGLRRVVCISGPESIETARDRAHGWKAAHEERALQAPTGSATFSTFDVEGGRRATIALCRGPNLPDGIVATNNLVAVGTLRALAELGLEDRVRVSVVGDLPFSTWRSDRVDILPLNSRAMGESAARLLIDRIRGESGTPQRIIQRTDVA